MRCSRGRGLNHAYSAREEAIDIPESSNKGRERDVAVTGRAPRIYGKPIECLKNVVHGVENTISSMSSSCVDSMHDNLSIVSAIVSMMLHMMQQWAPYRPLCLQNDMLVFQHS